MSVCGGAKSAMGTEFELVARISYLQCLLFLPHPPVYIFVTWDQNKKNNMFERILGAVNNTSEYGQRVNGKRRSTDSGISRWCGMELVEPLWACPHKLQNLAYLKFCLNLMTEQTRTLVLMRLGGLSGTDRNRSSAGGQGP